ncbi:MAG: L,D-transpeptidase [Alphaproteobacteria bacterium]
MNDFKPAIHFAATVLVAAALCGAATANEADWLKLEQPLSERIFSAQNAGVQNAVVQNAVVGANDPIITGSHKPVSQSRGLLQILFNPRGADKHRAATPRRPKVTRAVRRSIAPKYLPKTIKYQTTQKPGTIIIDTSSRYLYLVEDFGRARRYGVGVGRPGFSWSGTAKIGRKAEWPTWTPPAAMRKRQPGLQISMAGGPNNPLGARALYLFKGGRDTLYRIHGSNEPWTIGQAVSSGCIRMRNQDVQDLYRRVGVGTKVIVL